MPRWVITCAGPRHPPGKGSNDQTKMRWSQTMREFLQGQWARLQALMGRGLLPKVLVSALAVYLVVVIVLGIYWSSEPDLFPVQENAEQMALRNNQQPVTGYVTTATLITLAKTLLDKPGGYITNDGMPPGIWLDNMPSWEFGVLVQVRDMARSMRNDISRSQSQSVEDRDLRVAEPQFNFDNGSWAIPSTEREYRRGIEALESYLARLADPSRADAHFYARADNLRNWLANLETRLGSLSNRLSESVGKPRLNLSLAGEPVVQEEVDLTAEQVTTPWTELDDVFYEARGATWALLHLLRAVEVDFQQVLRNKNALPSLRQIIVELEAAQAPMWSPVILNGSGFGVLANHSLTMASYISRANTAIRDLRSLLAQG